MSESPVFDLVKMAQQKFVAPIEKVLYSFLLVIAHGRTQTGVRKLLKEFNLKNEQGGLVIPDQSLFLQAIKSISKDQVFHSLQELMNYDYYYRSLFEGRQMFEADRSLSFNVVRIIKDGATVPLGFCHRMDCEFDGGPAYLTLHLIDEETVLASLIFDAKYLCEPIVRLLASDKRWYGTGRDFAYSHLTAMVELGERRTEVSIGWPLTLPRIYGHLAQFSYKFCNDSTVNSAYAAVSSLPAFLEEEFVRLQIPISDIALRNTEIELLPSELHELGGSDWVSTSDQIDYSSSIPSAYPDPFKRDEIQLDFVSGDEDDLGFDEEDPF